MNVLMMTNTYAPHVGGVARSVATFARAFRRRGHRVVVVAPEFDGAAPEEDVVRVPAIQNFNGSDFSVRLPVPGLLSAALRGFKPDVVHAHHPFLLGDTALRVAHARRRPLVFTHHTRYELYTHYVPGDSEALRRFAAQLSTGYANLADLVFAPSESLARVLWERGVRAPIDVVPTGVEPAEPADRASARAALGLPPGDFVIGHAGRLAPEKNLVFLAGAVADYLRKDARARWLLVGEGPLRAEIERRFRRHGLRGRLHAAGVLTGRRLNEAYAAMDAFAFASKTETQGLVLLEAMAAGVPVVALDADGARDVVSDRVNGRLVRGERADRFGAALRWTAACLRRGDELNRAARRTAALYTADR
jgi:1,2-diacylglycerol 3-alpha-glucosyltransferase